MEPIPSSPASRAAPIAWAAMTTQPFMSPTPGPLAVSPRRSKGHSAAVPAGQTVSAWPSTSTLGPSPSASVAETRSPRPSSGSRSTAKPSPASGSAIRALTRSTPSGVVRAAVDRHERGRPLEHRVEVALERGSQPGGAHAPAPRGATSIVSP